MIEVRNLLEKITDLMTIIIKVLGLMDECFWFLWIFLGFFYFLECPSRILVLGGFMWDFKRNLQLVTVRYLPKLIINGSVTISNVQKQLTQMLLSSWIQNFCLIGDIYKELQFFLIFTWDVPYFLICCNYIFLRHMPTVYTSPLVKKKARTLQR